MRMVKGRSIIQIYLLLFFFASCVSMSFIVNELELELGAAVEICDNAKDDDNDQLIDLNDPDCECDLIEPLSLIPNPSFEEMTCCPNSISQLNCADVWIQASEATTDYLHTCGWNGWENLPSPSPYPNGAAVVGFRDGRVFNDNNEPQWKEYAGACLLGPLVANTKYRFEFWVGFVNQISSPGIHISFFGSTDCNNLPFGIGDEMYGCPTNGPGWKALGQRFVASSRNSGSWVQTSIDIQPQEDITTIAIGPSCAPITTSTSLYYFFDNLVLSDLRSFEFKISEVGHPCAEDFLLGVPEEDGLTYQWYKEGVALVGEKSFEISKMYGEGEYQVRVLGENICNLTKPFSYRIPEFASHRIEIICYDGLYNFEGRLLSQSGNYTDTVKNSNNCDSIVSLSLKILPFEEVDVSAKIFRGESYKVGDREFDEKGEFSTNLISSKGCDSIVHLDLDFYEVYIPNAFSPNGDGRNDRFKVFGNEDLTEVKNLKIFDRWGGILFNQDNLRNSGSEGWNGNSQQKKVNPGTYGYIATLIMDDGLERKFSGTILLVR